VIILFVMTVKTKLTKAAEQDHLLQIRVTSSFLRKLDDWRRKQQDLPTRSEAVRRLVEKETERR
jgi:hypothetical protein